jgi:proteasome assembly chaperone (PAC2) family protein
VIELEPCPKLTNPVLVAAFEGWNDAADAASSVLDHLMGLWPTTLVAALDPEDYYDFQVNRPIVSYDSDGDRRLTWPTTQIAVARIGDHHRDLVLLRGVEPNMRWRQFCRELVGIADELGVEQIVSLGALLADVPHTRPIPVSATATDSSVAARFELEEPRYEGPTGIVGVFADACQALGLPTLSVWAAVPHYVSQAPCPKATLAMLGRLEDLLDLPIPVGDLPEEARAWERGVDELSGEDAEIAAYVASLEQAQDTSDLPEASGDAIAREFERYLKRRQAEGDHGSA